MEKINKTENWFFEKIRKTDKSLVRLTNKKKDPNKQNKKWERWNYTTTTEVKKNHKTILWTLLANKLDNVEEMDKFLDTYNLPKSIHEQTVWTD